MNLNELLKKQEMLDQKISAAHREDGGAVADSEIVQLISFMLDDVEYGIGILSVHEILRMPVITRLPNTISYVKGVVNLRGNVIPVVDVRERFGLPEALVTELTRVIVVDTNGKLVGLLVDEVHQVVRLPRGSIEPPSDLIEGISEEFIKGIGRMTGGLIILINIDNILFSNQSFTGDF